MHPLNIAINVILNFQLKLLCRALRFCCYYDKTDEESIAAEVMCFIVCYACVVRVCFGI